MINRKRYVNVCDKLLSTWQDLKASHLTFRRFHKKQGFLALGNSLELEHVFWEKYYDASFDYYLRLCNGRYLGFYSPQYAKEFLERDLFREKKLLKLPNGIFLVAYHKNHMDLLHVASNEIDYQKEFPWLMDNLDEIMFNFNCTVDAIGNEHFSELLQDDSPRVLHRVSRLMDKLSLNKRQNFISRFRKMFKKDLTDREYTCACRLMAGESPSEMAYSLNKSTRTVEKQLFSLRQKTNSRTMIKCLANLSRLHLGNIP